jgi:hypothetical protein
VKQNRTCADRVYIQALNPLLRAMAAPGGNASENSRANVVAEIPVLYEVIVFPFPFIKVSLNQASKRRPPYPCSIPWH